jgi:hypothetical protein
MRDAAAMLDAVAGPDPRSAGLSPATCAVPTGSRSRERHVAAMFQNDELNRLNLSTIPNRQFQ